MRCDEIFLVFIILDPFYLFLFSFLLTTFYCIQCKVFILSEFFHIMLPSLGKLFFFFFFFFFFFRCDQIFLVFIILDPFYLVSF